MDNNDQFVDFDDEKPNSAVRMEWPEKQYQFSKAFFDSVCTYVCNGGNAINYVRRNSTKTYVEFMVWVNADPVMSQLFQDSVRARSEWFVQRLIAELKNLAFTDIGQAFGPDGRLLVLDKMPEGIRRAIASVETEHPMSKPGIQVTKIKLWDKKGSIDSFMKHLGMFIERLDIRKEVTYKVEKVDLDERKRAIKNRMPSEN